MNKDQIKGQSKMIGGNVKLKVGEFVDSPELQLKGVSELMEGYVQKSAGNIESAFDHAAKNQIMGESKILAGKIQKAVGEIVDSPELQLKGEAKKVSGYIQKGLGDATKVVDDISKSSDTHTQKIY